MDQARAYVLERARAAQDLLKVLPEGPVRDALDAFAVLIATRTS
jgi:heptaprenyl diphosphate synthase